MELGRCSSSWPNWPEQGREKIRGFRRVLGDILSDLVAGVAGLIGIASSANLNPERRFPSMFEPVHGSAPDIAGKASPTRSVRSGQPR